MFGNEAVRLLREQWPNPTMLAQELYAMFEDDVPLEHNAPITLTNPGTEAPLIINVAPGQPAVQFQVDGVPDGSITIGGDGPTFGGRQRTTNNTTVIAGGGGNAFIGVVQSGSGNSYVVVLDTGLTVNCIQQQIDSNDTIPAGTSVLVIKQIVGGAYVMQTPVWL